MTNDHEISLPLKYRQLARDYQVSVIELKDNRFTINPNSKLFSERYYNQNSICVLDDDMIIMGIYYDEELLLAHFFHELAHVVHYRKYQNLYDQYDDFHMEFAVWVLAFELASSYGLSFSNLTLLRCEANLFGYKKQDDE